MDTQMNTNLNSGEQILCSFMAKFFEENFENIDIEKISDSNNVPKTKDDFVRLMATDPDAAAWGLTEVARWGMKNRERLLDNLILYEYGTENFDIYHIEGSYIKLSYLPLTSDKMYGIEQAFPKIKTVTYFE
jgi:hypothetical protein